MLSLLRLPFLSLLFVVVWSSGWIGAKNILNYAGPLGALVWRYLIVVVVLIAIVSALRIWRRLEKRELIQQATIGLLAHTGFLSLSLLALEYGVSAGMVAFISALQPVFAVALAYPILFERINTKQLAGIILGVLSVILVIGEKITLGGSALIYCLPIFSVLTLTLATVYCRYCENQRINSARKPLPLLFVMLIQSSAALVGFSLLTWNFGSFTISFESGMYLSMAYLSVVVSIGSYFLYFYLLREMSAVKVSSFIYLTPPVTMLLGWILYHERISATDVAGLLVALLAVTLVTIDVSKAQKSKQGFTLSKSPAMPATNVGNDRNTQPPLNRAHLLSEVLLVTKLDIEL